MRPTAVPFIMLFRAAAFVALSALAVASVAQGLAAAFAVLTLCLIAVAAARGGADREGEIEARKTRIATAKAAYMTRRPLLAANVNIGPRRRDGAA